MKKSLLLFAILCFGLASAFSQTGSITNIQVSQRSDGSGLVDVYFDLSGSGSSYFMNLQVSFDAGASYFPITRNSLSGDTGPVSPESNRHIVWDATIDHPNRYSPQTKLRIVATVTGSQNPCSGEPTITDIDGNTYNTLLIGNQCWMKEDLKTTRDAVGIFITRYCYNDDIGYCDLYGGLYTWATIMNGATSSNTNPSGVQGICPDGWHIPSNAEWTQMTDYLINTHIDITSNNIGNKLKSCRQANSSLGGECNTANHPRWDPNSYYGTNDFGFSALPVGMWQQANQVFYSYIGKQVLWFTSTENSAATCYIRGIRYDSGSISAGYNDKVGFRYSVRCVKD